MTKRLEIGAKRSRYPGGDPENGMAVSHVWDGQRWLDTTSEYDAKLIAQLYERIALYQRDAMPGRAKPLPNGWYDHLKRK